MQRWIRFLSFGISCQVLAVSGLAFDYNGTQGTAVAATTVSATTISTRLSNGNRPTTIDAVSPNSTGTYFGAAFIGNTGSHYKDPLFVHSATAAKINETIAAGWRIEDIERTGSTYAALFTRYADNPVPTGWFVNRTQSQVLNILGSHRRLLELDSVVINGERKFNGVWVNNSGANAKAWGWMPGQTLTEIMDWANQNNMRVIDLDPRGNDLYTAVFVKRKFGERYYVGVGPWSTIQELQASTGSRVQVMNKLEGQDWYAAVLVNNTWSQNARVADYLINYAGGGRIGAYAREIGGDVFVDLRSTRDFYPASAIKVLIHAAGLAKVPVDQLDTFKIHGSTLFSDYSKWMMQNSHNPSTHTLNLYWGTDYINQFGRDYLGTTSRTWIANHYGDTPPDNNWNATSTLRDMTSIYTKRSVLGTARLARFRSWMLNETNTTLFNGYSKSLANNLGLTDTQYNSWRNMIKYEFKGGNIFYTGSNQKSHLHFVNVGRISLPYKGGMFYLTRHYVFGYFVNDSVTGYPGNQTTSHTAGLLREQLLASLKTFK